MGDGDCDDDDVGVGDNDGVCEGVADAKYSQPGPPLPATDSVPEHAALPKQPSCMECVVTAAPPSMSGTV